MTDPADDLLLLADPRVAAVPVRECGAPLVDLRTVPSPLVVEGYRPPALQERSVAEHSEKLRTRHDDWSDAALRRAASRYISPPEVAPRCYTAFPDIGAAAVQNRRALTTALSAVGQVNYPTEWWHWSFGDRYWAEVTGASSACYGPTSLIRTAG